MITLANHEDPDEMLHNAAIHQGLRLLTVCKVKTILRLGNTIFIAIINYNACIYAIDHPKFIVSNQKEESISTYRVRLT